jgi:hypothetical protein
MSQTVVFPISKNLYLFLLAVILCGGIFLRFSPTASFKGRGFDEVVYAEYVSLLDSRSLLDYPAICQQYVELQNRRDEALLPPTRSSMFTRVTFVASSAMKPPELKSKWLSSSALINPSSRR